jgi:hypothetical protein
MGCGYPGLQTLPGDLLVEAGEEFATGFARLGTDRLWIFMMPPLRICTKAS